MSTSDDDAGLGLASVRQIVLARGWRIRAVDPVALGGARFEILTGGRP